MNRRRKSFKCDYCEKKHLVLWKDVIERLIQCERFQKTAEYVSELLSGGFNRRGNDGFAFGHGGKLHVLKIVRWWSYNYSEAKKRKTSFCIDRMLPIDLMAGDETHDEPYDESKVFLFSTAFANLSNFYTDWEFDFLQYVRPGAEGLPLKDQEWLLIPDDLVIERNLPHVFTVPTKQNPAIHVIPVQLKYASVVETERPDPQGWFGTLSDIIQWNTNETIWTPMSVNLKVEQARYAAEVTIIQLSNQTTSKIREFHIFAFYMLESDFEATMPSHTELKIVRDGNSTKFYIRPIPSFTGKAATTADFLSIDNRQRKSVVTLNGIPERINALLN